jgi:hypothetical protein
MDLHCLSFDANIFCKTLFFDEVKYVAKRLENGA